MFSAVLLLWITFFTASSLPLERLCANRTIIGFGDSLTHGLYVTADRADKMGHHPYAIELRNLFQNMSVSIKERGIDGEHSPELMHKLPTLLMENRKEDPIFVIILAGTNDLAAKDSYKSIVWHVKRMHSAVQRHAIRMKRNIYTIAMSIPELKWHIVESDRISANKEIQEYAQRCSNYMTYMDLNVRFNQSRPEYAKLWSADSVHFSRAGYDKIGRMLFAKMKEFAATKTESSLTTMDFTDVCKDPTEDKGEDGGK